MRIFEGPRALQDDETKSNGRNFPYPKQVRVYLRLEQLRERFRDMPKEDRHELRGRERVEHLDRGVRFEKRYL